MRELEGGIWRGREREIWRVKGEGVREKEGERGQKRER